MPYELTFSILWQTKKYIPFLGREVSVTFISETDDDLPPTKRQIEIVDSLDNLTDMIKSELAIWARKDFKRRLKNWGITSDELAEENGVEIDEQSIEKHFRIDQVVIPRIEGCNHNYAFLAGECDWDVEHGIEFLLKNGVLIRCAAQEGLSSSAEWEDYLAQQ